MFSEAVEVWDATISAIQHRIKDGTVSTRLMVAGELNESLADRLGCKDLCYAKNGTPKGGFSSVELDTGCQSCRVMFEPDPALKQQLELNIDQADNFLVERNGDGKFRLKLRLHCMGEPFAALGYVLAVGTSPAVLTITPLQQELAAADGSSVEIHVLGKDGSRHIEPVAKETVRAALGAASKHRKGMVN
jgi:hypothetical protein